MSNTGTTKSEPKPVDDRVRERRYEILGVYFIALALLALLSLVIRDPGVLGKVAREALWFAFGTIGSFLVPFSLAIIGWYLVRWRHGLPMSRRVAAIAIASLAFWAALAVTGRANSGEYSWGGAIGNFLGEHGIRLLSKPGMVVLLAALFITALILTIDRSLASLFSGAFARAGRVAAKRTSMPKPAVTHHEDEVPPLQSGSHIIHQLSRIPGGGVSDGPSDPLTIPPVPPDPPPSSPNAKNTAGQTAASRAPAQLRLNMPAGRYELPSLSLLDPVVQRPRKPGKVASQARQLEETLANFGISARVIEIHSGPAVTRYDLQPAPGVKVSRIAGLADDLSLALAARGLRIEAPIPGKAAVGIEVPSSEVATVTMREVLEAPQFQSASGKLKAALGKDIAGETVLADLPRLPHLLIAGATGSGKSVCINTLLASILFTATPDEVKLVLIDPKRVELAVYADIPHLLSPVVTEPKKAAAVLKQVVREMENRYKSFAEAGARDLERFNAAVEPEKRKPSMVVIIDELADLMMVSPADVEESICRLAQMARATGIHLVVATQRPSVDVITGLIKANIPSRIAFAVSSQVDSRTILDSAGAEKLLGRGDMLFAPVGAMKPLRVQGAYISDRETEKLVAFWKRQGKPAFDQNLVNAEAEEPEYHEDGDELFYDALRVVVETGQASASLLQRKLRIGYSRAGRLIDMMESRGLVGPADGSRARDVLITGRQLEELKNRRDQALP